MAKKVQPEIKEVKTSAKLYNENTIVHLLALSHYDKVVIEKKYKGQRTAFEWVQLLLNAKLITEIPIHILTEEEIKLIK